MKWLLLGVFAVAETRQGLGRDAICYVTGWLFKILLSDFYEKVYVAGDGQ